jgi:hypothetical protein
MSDHTPEAIDAAVHAAEKRVRLRVLAFFEVVERATSDPALRQELGAAAHKIAEASIENTIAGVRKEMSGWS